MSNARKSVINTGEKSLQQLSKQDQDALLQQCADCEVLLYVELQQFRAELQAQRWAKSPKQAAWTANAGAKVWLNPVAAMQLLFFPEADVTWFEPDGSDDENHHFHDHVFFLEVPQTVTRENVYCDLLSEELEPGTGDKTKHIEEITNHDD